MAGDAVSDMDFFPHRVEHGGSVDMGGFFCVILNSAIWYLRLDILGAGMKSKCAMRVSRAMFLHQKCGQVRRESSEKVRRESSEKVRFVFRFSCFGRFQGKSVVSSGGVSKAHGVCV